MTLLSVTHPQVRLAMGPQYLLCVWMKRFKFHLRMSWVRASDYTHSLRACIHRKKGQFFREFLCTSPGPQQLSSGETEKAWDLWLGDKTGFY